MKKISILFIVLLSSSVFAQFGSSAVKLGFFSPSAAKGGFIIGYEGGRDMDAVSYTHLDVYKRQVVIHQMRDMPRHFRRKM